MSDRWPTARELMTPKPITLSTDAPVSKALAVMRSEGIHEVPILRKGRLAGMITFDTLARRTNLPLSTKVEHLMVLPPLVTAQTGYPELAETLLAVGIRGAPVVGKKGEIIGIVSRTDLVRTLPELNGLTGHQVSEVARPASLLMQETDPCSALFTHIRSLEEHPLPVVDKKGRLVGAVGIADLGRVLWRSETPGKKERRKGTRGAGAITIGSIMRSPALTIGWNASVGEAARSMTRQKVSSLFLVDGDRPTGIVSQSDLLGLAVGLGEPSGPERFGDVYVQIHGLRGSGDPGILSEIDELIAKGLRHIGHYVRPTLLSLHVSPHSARPGDASVHVRLHTDLGIFYATETGWNFFASVTNALDDLKEQTERAKGAQRKRRAAGARNLPTDDLPSDPELEAKLRAVAGEDDGGLDREDE